MTRVMTVEDATVPAQGDRLTVSHINFIAMIWLIKIDPRLLPKVRLEYTIRLKRGEALASLVEKIRGTPCIS